MTDVVNIDGQPYRLGLIHEPVFAPDLGVFKTVVIPKPPPEVHLIPAVWPMALNDTFGDCTIAGAVHIDQAGNLICGEPWKYCGDPIVKQTYFGLSGGQDTGLLLSQVLKPWHRSGSFLGMGPNGGFASVHPKNTTAIKQAVWIFGNAYVAVNLPAVAQQQFNPDGSGVWQLTGTPEDYNIEGGHCIAAVAYCAEGVWCVTWGSIVLVTWEWWFTYVVQVYTVVPPGFIARGGDARGFSLAQLDGWLSQV